MQAVLNTTNYPNLYLFLNTLVAQNHPGNLLIWSPESRSSLFDSPEKLKLVDKYARKLNLSITLSAASDSLLRNWAQQIGWTVLWEKTGPTTSTVLPEADLAFTA